MAGSVIGHGISHAMFGGRGGEQQAAPAEGTSASPCADYFKSMFVNGDIFLVCVMGTNITPMLIITRVHMHIHYHSSLHPPQHVYVCANIIAYLLINSL